MTTATIHEVNSLIKGTRVRTENPVMDAAATEHSIGRTVPTADPSDFNEFPVFRPIDDNYPLIHKGNVNGN